MGTSLAWPDGFFLLCLGEEKKKKKKAVWPHETKWVPREHNQLADYYSRLVDFEDYKLNLQFLSGLIQYGDPIPFTGLPVPTTLN